MEPVAEALLKTIKSFDRSVYFRYCDEKDSKPFLFFCKENKGDNSKTSGNKKEYNIYIYDISLFPISNEFRGPIKVITDKDGDERNTLFELYIQGFISGYNRGIQMP